MPQLAEAYAVMFVLPMFVHAAVRVLYWRENTSAEELIHQIRSLRVPNELSRMLRVLHTQVNFSESDELRITLFLPNFSSMTLHQVARYCEDGSTEITDTVVRMGTGDVGQAFTKGVIMRIDDVEALGGFASALRAFNVEESEAKAHHDQTRKSFFSYPIQLKIGERSERLGILSFDSVLPNAFMNEPTTEQIRYVLPTLIDLINGAKEKWG